MLTPENAATDGLESTDLAERLRAATEFLELIAANRGLLAEVSADDRRRFLDAAAHVYSPDAKARRQLVKATIRLRKAARVKRDESELNETGIRQLRTQTGLHHAERLPAAGLRAGGRGGRSRLPRGGRAAALLRLQAALHRDPSLLRPALPRLRRVQLRQAHRAGRPARPRRAAHRRPGEDRLPGRAQAAARRRAPDRHHALPARLGDALRRASRTSRDWGDRLEIFGLDLRHTPSVEAFCRQLLAETRPARLHRQQRLPDGAPPARVLPAHDGGGDGVAAGSCREPARRLLGALRGLARRSTCCRSGDVAERRPRPPHRRRAGPDATPPRCRRCRCCRRSTRLQDRPLPGGPARPGPAAGRPARPQLLAAAAGRGALGRAARGAAGQRGRAVHAQRAAQAADAAHAGPRQAHRQRVGGRGAVLPPASRRRAIRTPTWPRRRST